MNGDKLFSMMVDMEVSHSLSVKGIALLLDKPFVQMLKRAFLSEVDLEKLTLNNIRTMSDLGMFVDPEALFFKEDKEGSLRGNGWMFGFQSFEPVMVRGMMLSGMIRADMAKIESELSDIRNQCAELPKNASNNVKRSVTRGSIGMKLSHECCHAFGINRTQEPFSDMDLVQLELLTDSIAFLANNAMFGESAYLGVPYLAEFVQSTTNHKISHESAMESAKAIVQKQIERFS